MGHAVRALVGALLAALLCTTAPAQTVAPNCPPAATEPSAEQIQAGLRDARDRGFLWRISKGGRSSWLFGTVHVGRFGWTFPGPRVEAALRASDTIALEIDNLDPEMQRRIQHALREPANTPYPVVASLPYELRERFTHAWAAECAPTELLEALPPYLASMLLSGLIVRRDGLDPAYGIDNALAARGHREQRAVVSLETPEVQVKAMQAPGTPAQTLAELAAGLDDIEGDRAPPLLLRVAQLWADGDWPTFSRYAQWCDCLRTAAERNDMKRLLDDRNPGLAKSIDALHAQGQRVFAAVGSLHMVGPTGLPALMAQRGYRVERIAYPTIDRHKTQETTP